MTQDEIIEMARQAGFEIGSVTNAIYAPTSCEFELKVFAKLVAAKERLACAELCMDLHTLTDGNHNFYHFASNQIRARGEA
jgi:hypothetical protein